MTTLSRISKIFIILWSSVLFIGCGKSPMPLPYGYFRVDLPEHSYREVDTLGLPYRFKLSTHSTLISHSNDGQKYWIDIKYPALNASIYCSYIPINGNFEELVEDSRKFVYKHSVKADGIGEKSFENPQNRVYGILYDLKGNTASSVQFILTDSVKGFFRGSLYFENVPNKDSIAPMAAYIREDIIQIMESFEWKK